MITDLAGYNPERTYTTAAHDYDAALEQLWGFCARNTIKRLLLQPGDRVLDVACGPGPATLRAAERVRPDRRVEGVDISDLASVEFFFVSRVDTEVDRRLDKIGTDEAAALRGRAAVANARLAFERYEKGFSTQRWSALAAAGAKPQRPAEVVPVQVA
ncbi:hypothetical protein FDG2_2517 [Candidatus Protofrankia californiensis]|uniref:Methyltransferase domain-containing protein n=1 Tax=Candidatus Protofrankia californiensis TaxID=1839754 RepID=A0A1C3NXT2_9ACTN|nr:hypothetical protein FDG2_2517 [Candidatus Protofrankia californiensis]